MEKIEKLTIEMSALKMLIAFLLANAAGRTDDPRASLTAIIDDHADELIGAFRGVESSHAGASNSVDEMEAVLQEIFDTIHLQADAVLDTMLK